MIDSAEFAGTVAVVTGAARGMGAAHAAGLAALGAHVVATDLDEAAVHELAAAHNAGAGEGVGRIAGIRGDVRRQEDHELAAKTAVAEFGRLDHWVNNAGVFLESPLTKMGPELLHTTFGVNVDGVVFGTQVAARHMRDHGGGAIVNVASVSGTRVRLNRTAYCSSKAAVLHATRVMAVELGPDNIRVNSVAPGFIDTVLTDWVKSDSELFDRTIGAVPLRRIGTPDDVFRVVAFLLSSQAAYITGADVPVDGGSIHV